MERNETPEPTMIKVVTAEEMQKVDRYTINNVGVAGSVPMENSVAIRSSLTTHVFHSDQLQHIG